jgi:flavodoxin
MGLVVIKTKINYLAGNPQQFFCRCGPDHIIILELRNISVSFRSGCPPASTSNAGGLGMNIAIVYDSRTGTTAKAAESMGRAFEEQGHQCTVRSVAEADPDQVSQADLICIGSWTKGLYVIFQHPTKDSMRFIRQLGDLNGKLAVAFCTYKIATGKLLPRMAQALEDKGAEVVGQFQYRGAHPDDKFRTFARSLL